MLRTMMKSKTHRVTDLLVRGVAPAVGAVAR